MTFLAEAASVTQATGGDHNGVLGGIALIIAGCITGVFGKWAASRRAEWIAQGKQVIADRKSAEQGASDVEIAAIASWQAQATSYQQQVADLSQRLSLSEERNNRLTNEMNRLRNDIFTWAVHAYGINAQQLTHIERMDARMKQFDPTWVVREFPVLKMPTFGEPVS